MMKTFCDESFNFIIIISRFIQNNIFISSYFYHYILVDVIFNFIIYILLS